jgi:hypothetical protein
VRFTIKHTFDVDVDTFWDKVFFDPEYNEALFKDHLGFKEYNVLELATDDDGTVIRRVKATPATEVPGPVKKVLGDSAGYTEDGRFDPHNKRFTVRVTPNVAADKIRTTITMWVEPHGEGKVDRFVEVDVSVKVFGVGKMVEGLIEKQTRQNYDAAADFTQKWIHEKGL